jgi:saccharopine dehydrogenase-like NADP-dependent oxidoreductase
MILGGASGDVGRDLTRILVKNERSISGITITSRHIDTGKRFVGELGDPRVQPLAVDVTDINGLRKAIDGHDLVVNTVGPFAATAIPVMRASIDASVNYIDICDDIEPTLEALQLDRFAKESGVFVLLSMGWFPGMSNLRAKWLADQMDTVEEIVTAWVAGKKTADEHPSKGRAGTEHYLKALTGEISTFRNGCRIRIPIDRRFVTLSFPEPLGAYDCYQIEHPETATLPYVIPGVRHASTLGSLYPPGRNRSIRMLTQLIDMGLMPLSVVGSMFGMFQQSKRKGRLPSLNAAYIACIGTREKEKGQLCYSEVNPKISTAESTSQPLACAILLLASKKKLKPGVYLPETSLSVDEIIRVGSAQNLSFVTDAIGRTTWNKESTAIASKRMK